MSTVKLCSKWPTCLKHWQLLKVSQRNFSAVHTSGTMWGSNIFSNPMHELQPLVEVPLSSLAEEIFNPSEKEICEAHKHFQRASNRVSVYKGKIQPDLLPNLNLPEVG